VGDRPEDEAAARRAGVRFQWATNWIEQHQAAIASQLVDIH
jgi:D-glycero-D-manno-heptose 1,7-bisphosphate phosphatase